MKKIITAFFAFTFCFSINSFADFKEAAELFEQERYIEAYNEFFACYQHNDLRGNAYLRHLILTNKIDPERKQFWTLEELQKLEDTTSLSSENFLKASECYQLFLKNNVKFIAANKNKRKKIENRLKIIIKNLIGLHHQLNVRASIVLAQFSEDMDLRKRFNLSQPHTYYAASLQCADRDIYLSALQKGYLNISGYVTDKLYAEILKRLPIGEGELRVAKLNENKPALKRSWLLRAAHLGNEEALNLVLKNYKLLVTDICKDKISTDSVLYSDVLVCTYKAAYELINKGEYASWMGNLFDGSLLEPHYKAVSLKKDREKAFFWYGKSKEAGCFLGTASYMSFQYEDMLAQKTAAANIAIPQLITFYENLVTILDDESDYNDALMKENLSKMLIFSIQNLLEVVNIVLPTFSKTLDYIISYGIKTDKNSAKFYKAVFIRHNYIEGNNKEALLLLKEASATDCMAMNELGEIYEYGNLNQPIDFEKAFECYKNACELVDHPNKHFYLCYYNLATCYSKGVMCQKDNLKAYDLYKKALLLAPNRIDVMNQLIRCCVSLGKEYEQEAYNLLTQLCVLKAHFSDLNMAVFKLSGVGCKIDIDEAKIGLNKYYDQKNAYASYLLGTIELMSGDEYSRKSAKKYFKESIEWLGLNTSDINVEMRYFIYAQAKTFLSLIKSQDVKQKITSDSSTILYSSNDIILEDQSKENTAEEEVKECFVDVLSKDEHIKIDIIEEADYQQIIEEERQKSLAKKALKKQLSQSGASYKDEKKSSLSSVKLKDKQQQIFDAIMDPSTNQEVKWSQFKKLICGLMKKGDFLKPVGGSKFNIKLGDVQKQIHMPEHNEEAPLCPGRIKKARELLSAVTIED